MSALFVCEEPATWKKVYDKYWDVVEAKTKGKKPGKLLSLDKWYQEELPLLISSRPHKHVTLSELVKLMEWKLTKGKFRPRLQQLVASNSDETVEKCSRKAFSLLPDVQAAIAELSFLKGVGPATASVDPQQEWTPHKLELCLWALTTATQQQLPLLKDVDVKGGSVVEKYPDPDSDQRPTKKLKAR
ncbi:uncharacterized protein zgc:112496 isoform X2 [Channa argus]|uniref:uncharacterized protein zgc:112496 isoform X2 n=1 Tax=Channa argus TaxID=215402 RepID=UPI003520A33B